MNDREKDAKKKLSVVVPCYNEEESLQRFYEAVTDILREMKTVEYELVFIDDGSADTTLKIIKELAEEDAGCHFISFSRNFGKEAAMYAGLLEATGDYCVLMDADLQHPPTLLPQMYEALVKEGYDCCGGKRCGREGDGIFRSFCAKGFYRVSKWLTHMDMSDGYGDFRMMTRQMVDAILEMKEYNRYMKGIYSFVGFRTKWIPFHNVEREQGNSKWSFRSLLAYALEGILAFSVKPLSLAGVFSGVLIGAAFVYLLVRLLGGIAAAQVHLTQFDALFALILFLGGMQMLILYIVGMYLAKDCMENRKRPVFVVREKR